MAKQIRDEKYIQALASKVKKRRLALKLSTYQLADICDISRSQITDIEAGKTNPRICTLLVISKGLQMELRDLVDV